MSEWALPEIYKTYEIPGFGSFRHGRFNEIDYRITEFYVLMACLEKMNIHLPTEIRVLIFEKLKKQTTFVPWWRPDVLKLEFHRWEKETLFSWQHPFFSPL